MTKRITPGVAPRLYFVVLDSTGEPVTDLDVADITSIAYRLITGGVAGATSSGLSLTAAVFTDSHSTGSTGPVRAADGWYFCDAPVGAADASADAVELVVVLDDGTRVVYPSVHEIDAKVGTRSSHSAADVWSVVERTLTTVDVDEAAIATAVVGQLGNTPIVINSSRYTSSELPAIKIGDDYVAAGDGFADNRLQFSSLDLTNVVSTLSGMSVDFGIKRSESDTGLQVTGAIVDGSTVDDCDIRVPITGAQTAALGAGKYFFDLRLTANEKSVTIVSGYVVLKFTSAE